MYWIFPLNIPGLESVLCLTESGRSFKSKAPRDAQSATDTLLPGGTIFGANIAEFNRSDILTGTTSFYAGPIWMSFGYVAALSKL